MTYQIVINQLPLNPPLQRFSHAFWSLKRDDVVIAELQGLATDKFGRIDPVGLPFDSSDHLGLYNVTDIELTEGRFDSFSGEFMSNWRGDTKALSVTSRPVFTGSREDVEARWELATSVIRMVDSLVLAT